MLIKIVKKTTFDLTIKNDHALIYKRPYAVQKTPYNTFGNPAVSGLMDQGERVPSKTMPDAFNGLKTRYKLISTQQDCSDCPIGRTATRRDASDSQ